MVHQKRCPGTSSPSRALYVCRAIFVAPAAKTRRWVRCAPSGRGWHGHMEGHQAGALVPSGAKQPTARASRVAAQGTGERPGGGIKTPVRGRAVGEFLDGGGDGWFRRSARDSTMRPGLRPDYAKVRRLCRDRTAACGSPEPPMVGRPGRPQGLARFDGHAKAGVC